MSRQLTLSTLASVLAMASFVLFSGHAATDGIEWDGPRWTSFARACSQPNFSGLLPALQ